MIGNRYGFMNTMTHAEKAPKNVLYADPLRGLTEAQALEQRERYGANTFTREKPVSLGRKLCQAAGEPMILMLILAGLITLGVNIARSAAGGQADFLECMGIFAAIFLSVVITVVMEGRSAKAFEALNKIGDDTLVKVLRDGEIRQIPQKDVMGDILCVETGDKLPTDGRLLQSTGLTADESPLTGESRPVKKDASFQGAPSCPPCGGTKNMLFSGYFITGGHGRLAVTGVVDRTEFEKIARELSCAKKAPRRFRKK